MIAGRRVEPVAPRFAGSPPVCGGVGTARRARWAWGWAPGRPPGVRRRGRRRRAAARARRTRGRRAGRRGRAPHRRAPDGRAGADGGARARAWDTRGTWGWAPRDCAARPRAARHETGQTEVADRRFGIIRGPRARSSVDQSIGLRNRVSGVRIPPGAPQSCVDLDLVPVGDDASPRMGRSPCCGRAAATVAATPEIGPFGQAAPLAEGAATDYAWASHGGSAWA